MTTHEELVAEMASLERMSVQDRLRLARKRRAQQLKRWAASEKEYSKRSRKSTMGKGVHAESPRKPRIMFAHNIQLLEAAARGDIDEVRLLLESGVDPNIGNEDGLTALHQCCIDNNEAMMKLLVEHNADVNVTDRELWTPLHASSTCGHVNLARFLVSNGAELLAINSDGNMPYDICEDEVTLDYIESQMAEQGITQEQIDELRDVAPNQMLVDLSELKVTGGDLETRDGVGATYLHIAAANGYDKVAKFLLDSNVDVNARDVDGWQPIHAAACWAHGEMIQLLVQYDADLDAKTNNDETPLTICEDEELKNLINQLKAELHAHRSPESKLARRNSSRNKRSSSIRRSSKREKGEMRKLDAKGEAMFIQSQVSPDDIPATDIDEVNINTEESSETPASPTPPASVVVEGAETDELEDGEAVNGNLETDIVPMPVINEELTDSMEKKGTSPRNSSSGGGDESVVVNGGGRADASLAPPDSGLAVSSLQRQPKSILKKRKEEQEVSPSPADTKKSKKEKPEVDAERQRERKEEKERAKQQEREERQRRKEEKEKEKQRIREAKRQLRLREKEEKEKERLRRRTLSSESEPKPQESPLSPTATEAEDRNHAGHQTETLAELKRHRSSEHARRTLSGDSTEAYDTAWSEGRKDSFDMLKDRDKDKDKKKSPHIARKLLPLRPGSGSYSITEQPENAHPGNPSEPNGITEPGALGASDSSSTPLEPYPGDPPLQRFTAVGPEVVGGDEERRCCVIL